MADRHPLVRDATASDLEATAIVITATLELHQRLGSEVLRPVIVPGHDGSLLLCRSPLARSPLAQSPLAQGDDLRRRRQEQA